jgi:hypothetical protein
MGHIAGRAPEITPLDADLLVALDAYRRAFEEHAPLLLGMMMQRPLRVRRERHHREHRLLAGEDARRQAGRQLAEEPVAGLSRLWNSSRWLIVALLCRHGA